MRVVGLAVKKGELWISVIEGETQENCSLINTEKFCFQADSPCSRLMFEFYNIFTEVIEKYNPDKIAYKVYLDAKKDQIRYMMYPWGILNYICANRDIECIEITGVWLSAKKKGKKKLDICREFFNCNFDKDQLAAVAAAWYGLDM